MNENEENRFDEQKDRGLFDSQKEKIKSNVKQQAEQKIRDSAKEFIKKGKDFRSATSGATNTATNAATNTATNAATNAATSAATNAATGAATNVATTGATTAVTTGATTATTTTAAGATVGVTISFVLMIVVVILIVIAVIGLVAALMFLPSFTLSTVKEWIESAVNITMQWFGGGDSTKFKQEEIAHVLDNATYIRRMGYNLYNDGYIYKKLDQMEVEAKAAKRKKEVDKETGLEKVKLGEITDSDVYVPEEGIYEDESGNVKALSYENSPLLMYTWINGYTYFIDDMPGIWFKIGKTLGKIGEATGNFFKWVGETVGLYNPTEEDKNTGVSLSFTNKNDRSFLTYRGTNDTIDIKNIRLEEVKLAKHIHITGYMGSKNHDDYYNLIRLIKENTDTTISLDVGWDDTQEWNTSIYDIFPYLDVLFMNETEALHYSRKSDIKEAAKDFSKYVGTVVLKLGAKGALAIENDKAYVEKGFAVNVIDTTGAGDAFVGGLLAGLSQHPNWKENDVLVQIIR